MKYCNWQMERGRSICLRERMGDPVYSGEENKLGIPQEKGEKQERR